MTEVLTRIALATYALRDEALRTTDLERLEAINAELEGIVVSLAAIREEQLLDQLQPQRPRRWWRRDRGRP